MLSSRRSVHRHGRPQSPIRSLAVWLAAVLCSRLALAQTTPVASEFSQCSSDPRMFTAARALVSDPSHTSRAQLEQHTQSARFFAASLRYWAGRGSDDALRSTAQRWLVDQSLHATARCAWVRFEDRAALVLAPRYVELSWHRDERATPAESATQTLVLDIAPHPMLRDQTLVAMNSLGETLRFANTHSISLPSTQRWIVQLMASDGSGVVPWARVSVAPERSTQESVQTEQQPLALDAVRWIHVLNHQRSALHRASLRQDLLLQTLAVHRAQLLANRRQIAHSLDASDTPELRLSRAGIRCDRLGENVVRARTLELAFAQLNASPAHRFNRDNPEFDTIAIGTARGTDQLIYIVELLATHPGLALTEPSEPSEPSELGEPGAEHHHATEQSEQ